jgi:hypothetical protein
MRTLFSCHLISFGLRASRSTVTVTPLTVMVPPKPLLALPASSSAPAPTLITGLPLLNAPAATNSAPASIPIVVLLFVGGAFTVIVAPV